MHIFSERRRSKRRSNTLSTNAISEVVNGRELYEILESAHDPGSLEVKNPLVIFL